MKVIDFETWLEENKNNFFIISKYKKIFTPLELEKKYIDQSIYEDSKKVKILGAIKMPNGDIILHLWEYYCDDEDNLKPLVFGGFYENLRDINISDYKCSNNEENEEEMEIIWKAKKKLKT